MLYTSNLRKLEVAPRAQLKWHAVRFDTSDDTSGRGGSKQSIDIIPYQIYLDLNVPWSNVEPHPLELLLHWICNDVYGFLLLG